MFRYLVVLTLGAGVCCAEPTVTEQTFGTSRMNHPLRVYTIAGAGTKPADERPALLVVAGVSAEHLVGIQVAERLASRVWGEHAGLLADRTLYVVPVVNPDGRRWLAGEVGGVRVELGRTNAPFDADRDGRTNEDGPNDLNSDGMITMMRVRNPPRSYGLDTGWLIDASEPRLLRRADPEKGERGEYALIVEGHDVDGDGRLNEDGAGGPGSGVDVNMNFPTHWPEFREGAGAIPLSEPESLALVRWMQSRRNIVSVLVLGPGDSMLNKPATGQFDETGRMPKGLERGDEAYHNHVIEAYKKHVTLDSAPAPTYEGSLLAWSYADFGAWSFQSVVWSRPKPMAGDDKPSEGATPANSVPQPEPETIAPARSERDVLLEQGVPVRFATFLTATAEERQVMAQEFLTASEAERAAAMAEMRALSPELQARLMAAMQNTAGGNPEGAVTETAVAQPQVPRGGGRGRGAVTPAAPGAGAPAAGAGKPDAGELAWLTYSDKQRDGEGFVAWEEVEHPQFGIVEVGGFVPGFRINPPESEIERLADEQFGFVKDLLQLLPSVSVGPIEVERLSDQVWRVGVTLHNPGYLPTSSAVGLKIRQTIAVEIAIKPEDVISGNRVVLIDRLMGSGNERRLEWLIRGEPGQSVEVNVRSNRFGHQTAETRLEGGRP
ncbi:MAG: hypothetical protein KF757_10680 [Phycisphaeraceae bacterium]|nr:hypothetical protein [Phycisphaeraceae bacterium]MCW5764222.1 hypothetical protein [Phycisphaeraceae bacterium]